MKKGSFYFIYDKILPSLLIMFSLSLFTGWECTGLAPVNNDSLHMIKGFVQATTFNIKFFLPEKSAIKDENLEMRIRNRLKEIDLMLSAYNNDSEISRFNRSRDTGWFRVSPETAFVVDSAQQISRLTDGAFDVTIAPLIEVWGFGASQANSIPSLTLIEKAKKFTGYKNLEIRKTPPALFKKIPELSINLSAIAQGYTVDSIALFLDKAGISSYLVEIGGELKSKGRKPDGSLWRIGVAAPEKGRNEIRIALDLDNTAVSTSGDYQNYFEKAGKRYSHTINPGTGMPVTHRLASVTVVHISCMHADAMATAMAVLGPEEGYNLALKENLPVFLIIHDGRKFTERMTPEFEKLVIGR